MCAFFLPFLGTIAAWRMLKLSPGALFSLIYACLSVLSPGFDLFFVPLALLFFFFFITCGFSGFIFVPLHVFPSFNLPFFSRGRAVPSFGMVLVQGCPCGVLRLCRCCSGCVL